MRSLYKNKIIGFSVLCLAFLGIGACTDVGRDGVESPNGAPEIRSVSKAENDSLTTVGMLQNMYIIRGKNLKTTTNVYFNEYNTYFNPALVRDDNLIVTIEEDTPWDNASNKLRVETLGGSDEYDFAIAQPAPKIDGFVSEFVDGESIVVISGEVFNNLMSVKFDDVEAEIVSSSDTEITVKVPDGISQASIFVETPGGITQSEAAYGFLYTFYDDELKAAEDGFQIWGWGGTDDPANAEQVKTGEYSFKRTFEGNWGGIQFGAGSIDMSEYAVLKISIYAGTNASQLNMIINGDWDNPYPLTLIEGQWNDFNIPLSDLGSPETLTEFVMQEACNCGEDGIEVWIDDFGFN
ncbi:IPT/TIG domain-containing protein [Galbibacter sp. EGI 63066]|uniref:IPT/TIG domain-containing protein n=1 Tax=Galbibacter sp. EGI 63066 TaxID=2993559 RepID=UPI002249789D|nr:IPT/TIG domain-containing protein [Galbibacter sp. EGI 63066]MCX2678609.1 IPT/TIG domain-containing protein [Galbibacter sp. EGI 63066]